MRTLRLFEHITLDGIIQLGGPDEAPAYAHGDWTAPYRSPAGAQIVSDALGQTFDLLLGRRTYDLWSGHWPHVQGGPFADKINAATKHVATHRPESLAWGPHAALGADVLEGIRRLKALDGPDLIVWGSSTLLPLLFEQGWVDELTMVVYPVLLGRGKRAFADDATPREFAFVRSQATPTGVLVNTFRHVGPRQAA